MGGCMKLVETYCYRRSDDIAEVVTGEFNPYILFSGSCCLTFGPLCLSCCLTQVLPTRIAL